ncbi:O-antigen ligase family protein [Paenibacillus sp. N3.4]|uniref:O-antigen ligase family protein n=1 Tax=Paenibacillus sp. N3.4 TaxID=2603222 RepID=UPI001C9D54F0|nr:O-antigen ligase family protein [Paenibacillus sp. N3.4]
MLILIPLQMIAIGKENRTSLPQIHIAILSGMMISITFSLSKWLFLCTLLLAPIAILFIPSLLFKNRRWGMALCFIGFSVITWALVSHQSGLFQRLTHITLQAPEWKARLGYYHDAWLIILDSPFFGYGGGAWNILQYHYQTAAYSVRYLHNHWLETWIDTGITGLALYCCIVLLFVWNGIVSYRTHTGTSKIWTVGCLSAYCCLLLHSTVDFTFSYPLLFGIWVLLGKWGSSFGVNNSNKEVNDTGKRTYRIGISVGLLLLAFFSIRLGVSESFLIKSNQAIPIQKSQDEALLLLKKSAEYSFAPAEQHEQIAKLLLQSFLEKSTSYSELERAQIEVKKAISMNTKDPHTLLLQCQIEYALGNQSSAIDHLVQLKQQFPFRIDIEEQYTNWHSIK